MPHQKEAITYAIDVIHPALFCEQRLGKTLAVIRWVQKLNLRTVVVIAPKTVFEAWQRELTQEGERYLIACDMPLGKRLGVIAQAFLSLRRIWLLINYEGITATAPKAIVRRRKTRLVPEWANLPWDAVIMDESTKIKNGLSHIGRICRLGFRHAKHRAILTGMPSPEGETDLFNQFAFLHDDFLGIDNWWDFRNRFFVNAGFRWIPRKGAAKRIKTEVHKLAFIRRRIDVGLGSRKIYQNRYVDANPKQRILNKQIMREFAATLQNGETIETKNVLTQRLWLSRVAGGFTPEEEPINSAKRDEIISLLTGELAGEKVVIWFRFLAELRCVQEALKRRRISCVVVDGSVTGERRSAAIREFRQSARVMLAIGKCAQYGIDCSTADTAIYYSNELSGEIRAQSEDRIIHPQKKVPVLIIDILTRKSIDEDIRALVSNKNLNGTLFLMQLDKRLLRRWLGV